MIDFLAGVPGKLKTLNDLLNSTWAAKLDALRTGLTDVRMGYLDKMNITGNVAGSAEVAACAQGSLPMLKVPIASGIPTPSEPVGLAGTNYVNLAGLGAATTLQSTTSTSFVDITTATYTGSGLLKGLVFLMNQAGGGASRTFYLDILINGTVVMSYSYTTSTAGVYAIIPVGGGAKLYDGSFGMLTPFGLDNTPFTTSIQCRMKTSNADSTVYALGKIIKTS